MPGVRQQGDRALWHRHFLRGLHLPHLQLDEIRVRVRPRPRDRVTWLWLALALGPRT